MMKSELFWFCLLFTICAKSQKTDISLSRYDSTIRIYINGFKHIDSIPVNHLTRYFKIRTEDPRHVVKYFTVSWDDWKGTISTQRFDSDSGYLETNHPGMGKPFQSLFIEPVLRTPDGDVRGKVLVVQFLHQARPQFMQANFCHDQKLKLVCIRNDAYTVRFNGNKFEGWNLEDSLIVCDFRKRSIYLADYGLSKDSGVSIRLTANDVELEYGGRIKKLSDTSLKYFSLGRFRFQYLKGDYTDILKFNIRDYRFTVKIYKPANQYWRWEITSWNKTTTFVTSYTHKGPPDIIIADTAINGGISVLSRDRIIGSTRYASLFYLEEVVRNNGGIVVRRKRDVPYLEYDYNRFGRLRKKRTTGDVESCGCD